jgi:hypothetical protein
MNATITNPSQEPLSFEKVWTMFQENEKRFKENAKRFKETDRIIGKLGNRLGDIIENLMTPEIHKCFRKLGYKFTRTSRDHVLHKPNNEFLIEIDAFVENGDFALAIEVKVKASIQDVNEHIERMKILRQYADEHQDYRKYIGAIASPVFPKNVKERAIKMGFFVIEVSDECVKIDVPKGFKPKEW